MTTERRKHMNSIIRMDKIDKFDRLMAVFLQGPIPYGRRQRLARLMKTSIRHTVQVKRVLMELAEQTFSIDEMSSVVAIIQTGDGDIAMVDEAVTMRLAEAGEARQLLELYSDIMGTNQLDEITMRDWS